MVQKGSFSLKAWLQMWFAIFANWLVGPEHLYWAKKEAWDEYLGESTAETMGELEEMLILVKVPEEDYDWLNDQGAIAGAEIEVAARELLLQRVYQLRDGDKVLERDGVNRWRNISRALNSMGLNKTGVLQVMFEIEMPWSDIAVLDSYLLEDDDGNR